MGWPMGLGPGFVHTRFQANLSQINSTTGSVSSCWSELVSLSIYHMWLYAKDPQLTSVVVFANTWNLTRSVRELLVISEFMN